MGNNHRKYPRWLNLYDSGELTERAELASRLAANCELCPRCCRAKRDSGGAGLCGATDLMAAPISAIHAHHGEEPPISGTRGSGTVFFAGCNLHCVFCQNHQISNIDSGDSYQSLKVQQLAERFLELEAVGCHNLNLVTPSPHLPAILSALNIAAGKDFRLPLVYNCSGYESLESLKILDGIVDIYLPDIKFADSEKGRLLCEADDYFENCAPALKEMYKQVGQLVLDDKGIAIHGLLIRHLVLPDEMSSTEKALEFIASELSPEVHISLMSQYYPAYKAGKFSEISRPLEFSEYERAKNKLEQLGMENGWIQEMESNKVFRPDFERDIPFDN